MMRAEWKRSATWRALSAAMIAALLVVPTSAQNPRKAVGGRSVKSGRLTRKNRLPEFTKEREAAALTFVKHNHQELERLLEPLKAMRPDEYQDAIRELFQTSELLTDLRGRDEKRYEFALESWKIKSRIELLVARLAHSSQPPNQDLREQLRTMLDRQIELQIEQKLLERKRMESNIERIDDQIAAMRSGQADQVATRLQRVLRRSGKATATSKEKVAKRGRRKSTGRKGSAAAP